MRRRKGINGVFGFNKTRLSKCTGHGDAREPKSARINRSRGAPDPLRRFRTPEEGAPAAVYLLLAESAARLSYVAAGS